MLAMIIGMLPLAFAIGTGAGMRAPMARGRARALPPPEGRRRRVS
jgi:hypothetical protein